VFFVSMMSFVADSSGFLLALTTVAWVTLAISQTVEAQHRCLMHGLDQGLLPRGWTYLSRPSHQVDVCVRRRKVALRRAGKDQGRLYRRMSLACLRTGWSAIRQKGV